MQTVFKTFLLATVATYINCDMPRYASAQSLTVPGTLAEDTSNFVLLSASGTTVSIAGFSTDVQVIISSSTGLIRLGSTSGLTPATGYSDSLWLSGSGEIVFEGTQANSNLALQTLAYKNSGTPSGSISITVNPTGAYYLNNHYYKYNTTVQSWDLHRSDAATSKIGECSGYLATVTSLEEYNFILNNISTSNGWLGGADTGSEGTWKWMDGPEAGKTFYCDNTADSSCSVDIDFHKFPEPGEPNNCCGGEHHLQQGFGGVGRWNDYYIDIKAFYEYGGDLNQDGDFDDSGETCYPNTNAKINITAPSVDTDDEPENSTDNPPNLFDSKETIALVEEQKSVTNHRLYSSIDIVLDRIEWFWRNRRKSSLNQNDIRINLESESTIKVSKPIQQTMSMIENVVDLEVINLESLFTLEIGQIIDLNGLGQIIGDDFAIWTTGEITIGKSNATNLSLGKRNHADTLTIGIDTKTSENTLLGLALQRGYDHAKLGTQGTNLRTYNYGLIFYYSEILGVDENFKYILGFNVFDLKTTRFSDNDFHYGNRNAYQVLQSFQYEKRKNINKHYLSPYAKVNVGYTELRPYREGDKGLAIGYNELKTKTLKTMIGLRYDNEIKMSNGRLNPFAILEYGLDLSSSSDETAYYLHTPTLLNFYSPSNKHIDTYKLGIGLDYNFYTGHVGATFENYQEDNRIKHRTNKIRLKALFFF